MTPNPLVTPAWLTEHRADPDLRIVDTRKAEEYAAGHIPGAIHLDVFALHWADTSPEGLHGFRRQHEEALGGVGLTRDDRVVVYEDRTSMLAARLLWVLELFGQRAVFLLDGGLHAWRAAGYPIATEATVLAPTTYTSEWRDAIVADLARTREAIGSSTTVILDTRSREEYTGERVRAKHGGAIPGAVHLEYVNNMEPTGVFKSPEALAAQYQALGVTPDREVIAYCQGAYRAANTWLALRLAGYTNVRNYLGSWGEWGNRDDVPIARPTD